MPNIKPSRWLAGLVVFSAVLIFVILAVIWQNTWPMMLGTQSSIVPSYPGMAVGRGSAGMIAPSMEAGMPADMYYDKNMMPTPRPPGATAEDRARVGEKVIRNGSLTLRVDDAAKRLEELRLIVERANGFVSSASVTDNAGVKTAYVTVRVPNEKFDEIRLAAKALATTVFIETEQADDVTAQFVDLEARLKAAKAEEQQYLEILKRTGTIEDTLAVTQRLADVRARIEQLEGQMRYMNDQTTYATLSVTLTEETKVEVPTRIWKPLETFRQAARALVESLQALADVLITAGVFLLGLLVPLLLVLWLVVWAVMKIVKKMSKR